MRKYRLMPEVALLRLVLGAVVVLIMFAAVGPACADVFPPVLSCDVATIQNQIQNTAPPGTTIISAEIKTVLTTYCDVKGEIATSTGSQNNTVIFEVGLPDTWFGAFLFWGNGGFAGSLQAVDSGTFDFLLTFGLSVAATDTGHESSAGFYDFMDASFGLIGGQPGQYNLAADEDFSYRAVHLSTVASQAIVQAYYTPPFPIYFLSFFDGCSTGGRQGLVEAQNFPNDYRVIVTGDPSGIENTTGGFIWNEQAVLKSSAGYLSPSDIQLLDQAVLAECDGLDGLVDGLIQDPRKCHFDPSSLMCAAGQTTNCLNNQQVKTVQAILSGAVTNGNQSVYPGYSASDPGGPDGWTQWITGSSAPQFGVAEPWGPPPASFGVAPFQWTFQDQDLKYFVFADPNYNSLNFNLRRKADIDALNASNNFFQSNADNTDLSPFFNAGGKLLIYQGWSDPAIAPMVSVNYYTAVANRLYGGDFSQLQEHARLFMVPGMHHCGGGPGPNVFDPLSPAVSWGLGSAPPPDQIIANHYVDNDQTKPIDRSMPLCPYPQAATYVSGPVNQAGSWTCSNPPGAASSHHTRHHRR
jgi:feruloyl esterase